MEQTSSQTTPVPFEALESTTSLILNPSTSPSALGSAFSSLLRHLRCGKPRAAAAALSVLISVADSGSEFLRSVLEEDVVLALASSPAFAVRSRVLELLVLDVSVKDGVGILRPGVMFRVFFGMTSDLYPSVRSMALDGLASLCKRVDDDEVVGLMMGGVYESAISLFRDEDAEVRMAAIRLVSEWGQMLVTSLTEDVDVRGIADAIFIQFCTMARDMDVKVRIETFMALGKVKLVSEIMLLQSLSKKVLGNHNGEKSIAEYTNHVMKETKYSLSSAAGAYIHGLEDEFHEVRTAACVSLGMLTVFSIQFANGALNLLMDMLNDDTMDVRLQTLRTFLIMGRYDQLKVQEIHMHMFLGMLADISASIRYMTRKVLCVMTLPDMEMFKSSIHNLLKNLETYPKDEEDVLSVLFHIGRTHEKFAAIFLEDFIQEVEPSHEGEMKLDRLRVAALLVLGISAHLSCEKNTCSIPHRIFSYAIPFLGSISSSLQGIVDRDCLLAYLCCHSGTSITATNLDCLKVGESPDLAEEVILKIHHPCSAKCQIHGTSEVHLEEEPMERHAFGPSVHSQPQKALNEDATRTVELILRVIAGTWSLIRLQCMQELQCTLRACQEELELIENNNAFSSPVLTFVSQYIEVIHLIAEAWSQLQPGKFPVLGMQKLDFVLSKLDLALRKLRYTFPGYNKEEEFHVLELNLLCYLARLCRTGICSQPFLKRIVATLSRLQDLGEDLLNMSNFVKELKEIFFQRGSEEARISVPVRSLLKLFSLGQIIFSGKFGHIKAELQVPGNDSENPFHFVPGLPVGVTFQIILYNVSKNDRVWLQTTVGDSNQYAFLNLSQFEGSDDSRYCTSNIPFYGAPKAASFVMKAVVIMECPFEYVMHTKRGKGGPKYEITSLCKMKDVYFVNIND